MSEHGVFIVGIYVTLKNVVQESQLILSSVYRNNLQCDKMVDKWYDAKLFLHYIVRTYLC